MNLRESHMTPDELITGYLSGRLTREEQAQLDKWLAGNPAHIQQMYEMTEIWLSSFAGSGSAARKELAYQRFRQQIHHAKQKRILTLYRIGLVASIFLGVLFSGIGIYIGNKSSQQLANSGTQIVETPLGAKSKIVLPDGSHVWLNAGSRLSYSPLAFYNNRVVSLEGEGYFEVTSGNAATFTVQTSKVNIEVLGTSFNVKDYMSEDWIDVVLAEGSVRLICGEDKKDELFLSPGTQAMYNKTNGDIQTREVPVLQASAWTIGAHFFNELTLKQITGILEKSFDVRFIFRDETKKELTFYGDFKTNTPLHEILDIMSSGQKFNYIEENNTIEIF